LKVEKGKNKVGVQQQSTAPSIKRIEENIVMPRLFSDIVCTKDYWNSSWEAMYKFFEYEGPRVTHRAMTTNDSTLVSNTTFSDVSNLFYT